MQDRVSPVLERVSWDRYAEEVELAVQDAVRHYVAGRKGSRNEPVRQVAVWTDPAAFSTCVNLETEAHSLTRGGVFVRRSPGSEKPRVESVGWVYPSEFEFREYHCIQNRSLFPLAGLDFSDDAVMHAVMARVEAVLREVQQKLIGDGAFDLLPRGEVLGFGINSTRDWHDHVTEVPPPAGRRDSAL